MSPCPCPQARVSPGLRVPRPACPQARASPGPCPQARLRSRCWATNQDPRDPAEPSPSEGADSALPENTQGCREGALGNRPGTRGPVTGAAMPVHSEAPRGPPLPPRGRCLCRAGSVTATPAAGTPPARLQPVGGGEGSPRTHYVFCHDPGGHGGRRGRVRGCCRHAAVLPDPERDRLASLEGHGWGSRRRWPCDLPAPQKGDSPDSLGSPRGSLHESLTHGAAGPVLFRPERPQRSRVSRKQTENPLQTSRLTGRSSAALPHRPPCPLPCSQGRGRTPSGGADHAPASIPLRLPTRNRERPTPPLRPHGDPDWPSAPGTPTSELLPGFLLIVICLKRSLC